MEISEYQVVFPLRSSIIKIIPIGDIHLGSVGCDKKQLEETINYIKESPQTYWLGMGDYLDSINPSDKRFDPHSIDPKYNIKALSNLITRQFNDLRELFRPIKDKCIGLLTGNHEEIIRLHYYRDITLDLCRELGTTYLGYSAFIKLKTHRSTKIEKYSGSSCEYIIFACHGYGSARKEGAKVNRLVDVAHSFDADIILLAHEHKKIVAPPILKLGVQKDGMRNNVLKIRKQYACMTGSFLKGYMEGGKSYVERKVYPPTDLGVIEIKIIPDKKEIHCSI